MAMQSKFVELGGIRFNYGEGRANGPKLVFLPGFARYWSEYRPLLDVLEPHYHVFALSLRGQGLSERAPPYTFRSYAADTVAFMDKVVGRGAFGVAHSAGAWVGLSAANHEPDLFGAFVSIDMPLNPEDHIIYHGTDTSGMQRLAEAMRGAAGEEDLIARLSALPTSDGRTWGDGMSADELGQQARQFMQIDPETFAPWADGIEGWLRVRELTSWPGRYKAPLLFLDGDPAAGSMLSAAAVRYNLERYPWAKRVELKGFDHIMGLRSAPETAFGHIHAFFENLP